MSEKTVCARNEIDEKYKWAINDIYATDELWTEDLEKLKGYSKADGLSRAGFVKAPMFYMIIC